MGTLQTRAATLDDAPHIAAIHVRTWQHAYRGMVPDAFLDALSIEDRTDRWQQILTHRVKPEQTFVAELDDAIVGFCSVGSNRDLDVDETIAELYAIYVDPQSFRQGAGSLLIKAGADHLRDQGFAGATLWVLAENQRARRFYESQGWHADGKTKHEEIGNAVVQEVRYARSFSQSK